MNTSRCNCWVVINKVFQGRRVGGTESDTRAGSFKKLKEIVGKDAYLTRYVILTPKQNREMHERHMERKARNAENLKLARRRKEQNIAKVKARKEPI